MSYTLSLLLLYWSIVLIYLLEGTILFENLEKFKMTARAHVLLKVVKNTGKYGFTKEKNFQLTFYGQHRSW